ncbi:MAG: GPW/gp25 family protein [Candidatus Binataceae bacterium]
MPAGAITLADITSTDWSLSLDTPGQPGSGIGHVVQGLADVDQCIQIILTTPQGSDPLRPTFAAHLWQFVDYPINAAIPAVVGEVTRAISLWEPRVRVISVAAVPVVDSGEQSGAHLNITVTWQLKLGGNNGWRTVPSPVRTSLIMIPASFGRV